MSYIQVITTGADDPSLAGARVILKESGYQYQWLASDYDLKIGIFRSVIYIRPVNMRHIVPADDQIQQDAVINHRFVATLHSLPGWFQ